jgi:heterodisulfide reductase subunit D
MDDISFEAALDARVHDMGEACIRCGKCVEACPTRAPAGIAMRGEPMTIAVR